MELKYPPLRDAEKVEEVEAFIVNLLRTCKARPEVLDPKECTKLAHALITLYTSTSLPPVIEAMNFIGDMADSLEFRGLRDLAEHLKAIFRDAFRNIEPKP